MEWKEYQIQDVCRLINGRAYSNDEMLEHGKYKIVRVGNLSGGNSTWFYSDLELPADKYCHNGDLLFAWACTFGPHIWKEDNTIFHYHIWKIVEDKDVVDRRFFYYYLKFATGGFLGALNGSVMVHITKSSMEKMSIRIPKKLEDQRRIASILSSLDRKIELNNKINADLEEMAQAIFKNWFVDFEPFKDGKFVDSELGMIPEGWKVGTLGDITKNKSAKVKERNDVKVLSPVTTGELVLSEEYFTKQVFSSSIAKYKIVNKGDFAYNPARVNIGSIGRNEFDFDGCVSPVYVVFSVLDGYENYFDLFRKTDFFKDSVASLAIGGVRQSLSYDDLSLIETIIPSKNIVEKFNDFYNQMKKTIKANKLENSRLSLLRDTLLPRLMSGELEVPE